MYSISILRQQINRYLVLIALITFVTSCSKKTDPTPDPVVVGKSSAKDLSNIGILKSENSGITGDGYFFKSGTKIYISVPLNSNLTAVKTNFSVSNKASIKVNGTLLTNNSATLDLTKTLTVVVSAEDGSLSTYTILAQTGVAEIDKLIYPFLEKFGIPAASYAIAKNSKEDIIYKNAVGFANVSLQERVTPDYEFRLASMSKQHTAIAILSLVDQGKITLNSLVFGPTGILKGNYPSVSTKAAKITVRHLLEHTAGFSGDPMFSNSAGTTMNQKMQFMLNSSQEEPGTKFSYYNMGYGTLGLIIEAVSGKEYGAYLKDLYTPLDVEVNLASPSIASKRTKEVVYYPQLAGTTGYGDISVYKAAGGVSINTENLFKVLYAVDGGNIRPDILTPASRIAMFTRSTVANYSLGWNNKNSTVDGYFHGGNLSGTATFWIYGPEHSAAILLNSRNVDANFDSELTALTINIMAKAKALNL